VGSQPSLYAEPNLWHHCTVRFPLPIAALAALAFVGCATTQQKATRQAAKAEQKRIADNTRANEQRRMTDIENRQVNSARGAQILDYSPDQTFDVNHATSAAAHGVATTGKAHSKDFYSDRQMRIDAYQTRNFYDSKPNQAAQRNYATGEANTKGKFLNLFAHKKADTRTAATKEAWDANKGAPTRPLTDGRRPYLGPESKKLNRPVDAAELANWRNGGSESVGYTDTTVERVSTMKQLSVDDIRDLLNKSK
jgi:hypothetical protein